MDQYELKRFTNEMAYEFAQNVLAIIKEKQLKPVRIRVTYEGDIVFQYMMDGKKGDEWLNRKEKTVMDAKNSSMYVFEHQDEFPEMSMEKGYAICGGGVPVVVDHEVKGAWIVSGLAHDEDHALIIEALERMVEK